ncbi:MAG: CHAT domain-containing protein, partial [Thermoanaerobaculia bacterium]
GQTGAGKPPAAAAPGGATLRGTPAVRCASLGELRFPALPGSVEEVLEVRGAWSRRRLATAPGAEPLVELTGAAATEGALTRAIRGRRIVHLATHGFALGAACAGEGPASGPSGRVNPLVLSGLAVAGANRRLEPSRAGDDGILTAEEVAGLDLRGAEWVVLSGCDTGAGDVERFEGVIGLRRSFRMAGARTLVFSLWPVEDRAAAQWMRDLYAARFAEGLDTAAAVRQASLRNLDRRRRNGESTHPFFWAAFVAEGDWR